MPLTQLSFLGGAEEQRPKSSSQEHAFPQDKAIKGTALKVLSLNSSHAAADRHKPHWMTHSTLCLPVPEQLRVPAAERSSLHARSHRGDHKGTGSIRPCNYSELPGRKTQLNARKNPPAWGSPKGLILLQHAANSPALLRKDAAQHLKGATSHLGSFSPSFSNYGVRSVLCSL